ncbi:GAF domain-containing sensor histidine kinase [Actinomarinicola tropica]|uniref:histidine kinase n=1 Tax=Actinomarinicola tropica TaxID=2789776 RepID=A0A5Q2RRQ4_9ACTN|nr:GAF domain-containing sensor histidine kinase [Actinomarinicola tropica]QGG96827.1 sensor histidine kinase [Actinomarinicola tropica]
MNRRVLDVLIGGGASLLAAGAVGATALAAAALVAGELPGREGWGVAPVLVATGVGAATWRPARRVAREAARRGGTGGLRATDRIVRTVAGSRGELGESEVVVELAAAVRHGFAARRVAVWQAGTAGELVLAAVVPGATAPGPSVGLDAPTLRALRGAGVVGRAWLELWLPAVLVDVADDEVRAVPVTHEDVVLALVVLARPTAARFTPAEDALLADLGDRLGVVLHNRVLDATLQTTLADLRRTNEELRASRVRLVTAADAERRRIERDLHDGAQQRLVALAVHLRLAEQTISEDPAATPEVLGTLGAELREAIADLRNLAHGIYPPLLMDAGLVEAVRAAADRSPAPVSMSTDGVRRYPSEVEAAAYFCCVEALQNVAKHAPTASVRVTIVDAGDGQLVLAVEDDGPGFDPGAVVAGHGLMNMADRVGAVGGRITWAAAPGGGTRVDVRFDVDTPVGG